MNFDIIYFAQSFCSDGATRFQQSILHTVEEKAVLQINELNKFRVLLAMFKPIFKLKEVNVIIIGG